MVRWVNFIFSIFGAFFLLGFSGALIGYLLGVSETPVAGFLAAFGVVSISYTSAPIKPKAIASFTFILGSLVSWFLLKDFTYSNTSHFLSAQASTYLPLLLTNLGGLMSLLIIFFPKSHAKNET